MLSIVSLVSFAAVPGVKGLVDLQKGPVLLFSRACHPDVECRRLSLTVSRSLCLFLSTLPGSGTARTAMVWPHLREKCQWRRQRTRRSNKGKRAIFLGDRRDVIDSPRARWRRDAARETRRALRRAVFWLRGARPRPARSFITPGRTEKARTRREDARPKARWPRLFLIDDDDLV